jgi:hypothetical protein
MKPEPTSIGSMIGRLLQLAGLIILPVALFQGLVRDQIRLEVMMLGIGGFLFLLGWILSRPKG